MRWTWERIAGTLVLLIAGCSHPTTLEGSVLAADGAPVGRAPVVLLETGERTTTSSDGRFAFVVGEDPEALTVQVDGWDAAGGPYSFAAVRTPMRPWNLAPGGAYRRGALDEEGVVLSTAAVLTRLQVEGALPIRASEGGTVVASRTPTSPGYPGARLLVPGSQQGWEHDEERLALTWIRQPLLPVPPPDRTVGLAAVHIHPEGAVFEPGASLELPGPAGLGTEGEVRLFRLDRQARRFVELGAARVQRSAPAPLSAPGLVPGGGYYLFAVAR